MQDSLLPQVESEMEEIKSRVVQYEASADQALDDLQAFGARARELEEQLKRMRRRLCRNTKRLCDALDAVELGHAA